jgi:hypothetical protein
MELDATRLAIESLLKTLLELGQVQGCVAEDDRGDAIASVGTLRAPDAVCIEVPLRLGGRLVVWFRERSAYGILRTYARRIEAPLSELVGAYERSLVRPPRLPGSK